MKEPVSAGERILVLTPDRDSPPKHDFQTVFRPAATVLAETLRPADVDIVAIPVPTVDPVRLTITSSEKQKLYEQAARATCDAIEKAAYTRIVFVCHGWSTGLQLGFRTAKFRGGDGANFNRLCTALMNQQDLRSVTLFACSAGDAPGSAKSGHGSGQGSFAQELMFEAAVPVLAHWTAGHATRNPDLIHFSPLEGTQVPYVRGGDDYIAACENLLSRKNAKGRSVPPPPPKGHSRPAWVSLVLCSTVAEVRDLLASPSSPA